MSKEGSLMCYETGFHREFDTFAILFVFFDNNIIYMNCGTESIPPYDNEQPYVYHHYMLKIHLINNRLVENEMYYILNNIKKIEIWFNFPVITRFRWNETTENKPDIIMDFNENSITNSRIITLNFRDNQEIYNINLREEDNFKEVKNFKLFINNYKD